MKTSGNARAFISAQRARCAVDIGYDQAARAGYVPPRRRSLDKHPADAHHTAPVGPPIWADENDWTKAKYQAMDKRFCRAMRAAKVFAA